MFRKKANVSRAALSPLLAVLLVACLTNPVWSQVDTSRSYSFGDSLTDNDYLFLLFGTDPTIYGADPFQAMFNKAADEDDELANFAVLGSTSADVLLQVESYVAARRAGDVQRATLISLQGGGNDFLTEEHLLTLALAPPRESVAADAIVSGIAKNLLSSVLRLKFIDRGVPMVLWTVPDVTLTPYVYSLGLDAQAEQNIRLHIERLNRFIRQLGKGRRFAVLDISSVLTEVSLNPPVILGTPLYPPPYFGFATAIFADPIHPTAVSNGILANEMIGQLNAKFDDNIPFYSEQELADLAGLTP
jgi:phospholipase/lecithinase/hemolysin